MSHDEEGLIRDAQHLYNQFIKVSWKVLNWILNEFPARPAQISFQEVDFVLNHTVLNLIQHEIQL